MNKILFGGSFDPIHLGHINMALQASKQLDADVIFLPSPVAVWKTDSIDVEHKIKMISLAIEDYPRFHIDLYEVEKGEEQNYSIDTVRYFVNKYPNDTFFYLIGADHVNAFHKWKEAEELSKLANIIFFARPNLPLDEENIKKYHMKKIVGSLVDVSSTDIRALKSLETDKKVIDYIVYNNLYFIPKIRSFIKEKRFNHSVSVASLAYGIAKNGGLARPDKAYIAGLLHDVGKETDPGEIMVKHYNQYLDMPKFSYHQFVGEYIAKTEFGIEDEDILEAIKYHATGNEKMSILGRIIYAADKIEPTRGFDSSDLIKAMINDIESGFITVLKANKEFLISKGKMVNDRLTSNCFKYYKV